MNESSCGYECAATAEPEQQSGLYSFAHWYSSIHGYCSIVMCVFGVVTNVFNISVLTRRDMTTSTNVVLTWLAIADLLTMVSYVPFAFHFYCFHSPGSISPEKNSYPWMTFFLVHINFGATTHTISNWLGVSLAALRYQQLKSTARGTQTHRKRIRIAKFIVAAVYCTSVVGLIPNYLSNEIHPQIMEHKGRNVTIYAPDDLMLATNETELIVLVNVVCYGLLAKLIPCILMSIFAGALLYTLGIKEESRRRRLSRMSSNSSLASNKRRQGQSRTTRMLLVVLILFLITEFPQAVLILLSVSLEGFFESVYIPLGDLMDFIALMNNGINFILYCSMSQQFRARFLEMYCHVSYSFRLGQSFRAASLTARPFSVSAYRRDSDGYSHIPTKTTINGTEMIDNTYTATCVSEVYSALPQEPPPPVAEVVHGNFLAVPAMRRGKS